MELPGHTGPGVRVAEWSKAPDSSSGPRMWAWVQIPLLTHSFDLALYAIHLPCQVWHILFARCAWTHVASVHRGHTCVCIVRQLKVSHHKHAKVLVVMLTIIICPYSLDMSYQ